ncbi:10508_t:CDS:2, partial [Cetraspora pellucida]
NEEGSQNETSSFNESNIQLQDSITNMKVNINQNETSKIPFNETTNIISSDNTSIKKWSSELQLGKK